MTYTNAGLATLDARSRRAMTMSSCSFVLALFHTSPSANPVGNPSAAVPMAFDRELWEAATDDPQPSTTDLNEGERGGGGVVVGFLDPDVVSQGSSSMSNYSENLPGLSHTLGGASPHWSFPRFSAPGSGFSLHDPKHLTLNKLHR